MKFENNELKEMTELEDRRLALLEIIMPDKKLEKITGFKILVTAICLN